MRACVEKRAVLGWNKSNTRSAYSNLGGGAYGHPGLVLTDAQYALILNTPLIYLTHLGPLIIPDGTIVHMNSNMRIKHTEAACLFREVTGIDQALIQHIITTVEENYTTDTYNWTKILTNDTVAYVLTHLQDNYVQIMPQKLLDCKEMVKKTIYHLHEPIASVFSVVKELLELADIPGISYAHNHDINIAYAIIHSTGKFSLVICEWNCMLEVQNTWVGFKHFFRTAHRELRETMDIAIQDTVMHHENMVRNVVAEIHGVL